MKKKTSKSQFQIRISDEMEARIDKYQQYLVKTTSLEVTFAATVRRILEDGLARFEKTNRRSHARP